MGDVDVLEPGFLTTIQDAIGRPGLGRYGIPRGGAVDTAAAILANRLVGNPDGSPVLEMTTAGPRLRWEHAAHVALAGADLGCEIHGLRIPPGHSVRVEAGSEMAFGLHGPAARGQGARTYLAVEGGFDVESVLGSTSTDRRSGFGGFEGRALGAGDVLSFAHRRAAPLRVNVHRLEDPVAAVRPILVIPTAAVFGWFPRGTISAFCESEWNVGLGSDRSGLRLEGLPLRARSAAIASLAVPVGSIQVPPSGQPIITMADGPVTGGYPVIGVVPRFEHGRLAQAVAGDVLRFQRATVNEARRAARDADWDAPDVEIEPGDFAAGWAR